MKENETEGSVFSEEQLAELGQAATQLSQTLWMYYTALKEKGFGDLQAIELCKGFQQAIFDMNKQ